ncbi:MAG: hypothetical protein FJ041_02375 [Candidatus Cloacimonetes bacterium]|nr:hypothetical protein [Candidatus Cloacimonadota bacterium]
MSEQHGLTIIVKKVCQFIVPPLFLFGIYITVYGHLSPGGGFTGGVIMASAFIFQILAEGSYLDKLRKDKKNLELAESASIFGLLVLSVLGLILGGAAIFFRNFLPAGKLGDILSSGFIPIGNLIIGIEVCASITLIYVALLIFKDEETQ